VAEVVQVRSAGSVRRLRSRLLGEQGLKRAFVLIGGPVLLIQVDVPRDAHLFVLSRKPHRLEVRNPRLLTDWNGQAYVTLVLLDRRLTILAHYCLFERAALQEWFSFHLVLVDFL